MITQYNAPPIAATYDFDGTIALTSEACPGGVDVDGAYAKAITEIFDADAAESYRAQGGHNSRTPLLIVDSLRPGMEPAQLERLTQDVTAHKLDILLGQIGTSLGDGERWPRPTDGFPESWQEVYETRHLQRIVAIGIISAGHTKFIERWFDAFGLPQPDRLVTVETIDNLNLSLPPEKKAKPHPLPMAVTLKLLRTTYGITRFDRTVYHGDSWEKDGGLAFMAGAKYIHITPETAAKQWQESTDILLDR